MINWEISQLHRISTSGEVFKIYYIVVAKENGIQVSDYGNVVISPASPENMIPFQDLTLNEVVDWVKSTLGINKVQEIERLLLIELKNQQENIVEISGLPWSNV